MSDPPGAREFLMRWTIFSFLLILSLFTSPALPQLGTPLGRCGAPPRDAASQNQPSAERVPLEEHKPLPSDKARLQKDAEELADLAASIRADIERANQGLLSKDSVEKLKRVEKLSRHLRSELTR